MSVPYQILSRLLLSYYLHYITTISGPLSATTRVNWHQNKHSPTHTYPDHQSSFICFLHLQRSIASSLFNLCAWQSFCIASLQDLLGLHLGLEPHTSYSIHFFSPNHYLLFATHAHTIATCFAVLPRLCHLILVSLSTLYLELYLFLNVRSIWPFSSLPAQVPPYFLSSQARSHFHATTTSHTTVAQSPSHYQWYILTGKQWYQVTEFIPSNSNSTPQVHQHLHPHSACYLNNKIYALLQICTDTNIYTCATCTGYWIQSTSTNKWLHHFGQAIFLHHHTSCESTSDN